ncbi:thymine-DNA glycosylase [Microdochium nivale]|nr:thymine-DNA glycosylase [Microdochium nivale]
MLSRCQIVTSKTSYKVLSSKRMDFPHPAMDTRRRSRRLAVTSLLPETAPSRKKPARAPRLGRKPQQSSGPSSRPDKHTQQARGKYAHLPLLRDTLIHNLICVFVGMNPGIQTATDGHAYAHPSNLFWRLLHTSGCTGRRCRPDEDGDLPRLFALGNTNLIGRPTRNTSELSKQEMAEGTPVLEAKIREYKPEAVCFVGKGIWEAVWRWKHGRDPTKEEFRYGWQGESEKLGMSGSGWEAQDDGWNGAAVFVATSTSGLAASLSMQEKEAIWRELGVWVEKRREQRCQE